MSRRVLPRILMLLCLLPLGARAQQKLVAQRFIGAWKLISVEGEDPVFALGYDHPSGMIIYDASGWMSAQIAVKGDRKPFARGLRSGTLEEKATAFDSFFAYYRTYTVDLEKKTVHTTLRTIPGWTPWSGQCPVVRVPGQMIASF